MQSVYCSVGRQLRGWRGLAAAAAAATASATLAASSIAVYVPSSSSRLSAREYRGADDAAAAVKQCVDGVEEEDELGAEAAEVRNWSDTHAAHCSRFYAPSSREAVLQLVREAHEAGERLRPSGNGLSPNGASLSSAGMLSMRLCGRVLDVDTKRSQVTVESGISVGELVSALREHGLTLQNFASIREQQLGGFVQAGCHGTGAFVPPVDEQVVALTIATPARGEIKLSKDDTNPSLFYLARVGMGLLGVVTTLTLQCVPRHRLVEHTYVLSAADIHNGHEERLRQHKHMRYMWIPYTDTVVVVACDPVPDSGNDHGSDHAAALETSPHAHDESHRLVPLRSLYRQLARDGSIDEAELAAMGFADLRSALLDFAPLDANHVKRVNEAEAEFWRRSAGVRVGWSDEILGFECGGQQWVSEVAFPTGSIASSTDGGGDSDSGTTDADGNDGNACYYSGADIAFMRRLMRTIEANALPAPAPLEQRWSASSRSAMSPAGVTRGDRSRKEKVANGVVDEATVLCWVGIIMYLPTSDGTEAIEQQRHEITEHFNHYTALLRPQMDQFNAHEHWAKIEARGDSLERMKLRLAKRYPVREFGLARAMLDPKGILGNDFFDSVLPPSRPPPPL